MWRIYSRDKNAVRIKTNAYKLFNAVCLNDECIARTWIGKVEYDEMRRFNNELKSEIKGNDINGVFQKILPKTYFMKRKEFRHEKEFRIVFLLDSTEVDNYKMYKRLAFRINVNYFIEEYCLDPRLTDKEYSKQKSNLMEQGVNSKMIRKSDLYAFAPQEYEL